MSEDSLKNDPTSQWPEEVKQAYESLKIPSIYDTVLASEKLGLEIRKQNRDVKLMAENMGKMVVQLDNLLQVISEEWEEYEEEDEEGETLLLEGQEGDEASLLELEVLSDKQIYLEKQTQDFLIEMTDSLTELCQTTKQRSTQLLHALPKKEGVFGSSPEWRPLVEELAYSFVDLVTQVRYKLLSRLEEKHIHLIEPRPGDVFDRDRHHALDEVEGGDAGTIARVIRPGYRRNAKVLRLAEVVVYTDG